MDDKENHNDFRPPPVSNEKLETLFFCVCALKYDFLFFIIIQAYFRICIFKTYCSLNYNKMDDKENHNDFRPPPVSNEKLESGRNEVQVNNRGHCNELVLEPGPLTTKVP